MSSSTITHDRKHFSFEVNGNGMAGTFVLHHLDGDGVYPDKIHIKFNTQVIHNTTLVNNSNSIIIDKRYAKTLSNCFRGAADLMDEWFVKGQE